MVPPYDAAQSDEGFGPLTPPLLNDLITRRYSRRQALKGLLAMTALSATAGPPTSAAATAATSVSRFAFAELLHGVDDHHHVAPGYQADILIRWGDPVTAGAPPLTPKHQTPDAQEQQFGYNNDFVAYLPLPVGSNQANHGLLFVNHEYTSRRLMFPGLKRPDGSPTDFATSRTIVDIEMSAHGASIVEIKRTYSGWKVIRRS